VRQVANSYVRDANSDRDSELETRPSATSPWHTVPSNIVKSKQTTWPVFLFLVGVIVPWVIPIGPMRMSVYRIVLVMMILPCLKLWISGGAGRIRMTDICLILYCFWCMLSYIVNNGPGSIQSIGITFIETAGSYLIARCYIRDEYDFYNMVRLQFKIVLLLFPFAVVECLTGQNILLSLFDSVMSTQPGSVREIRGGLTRVYLVFENPILFGVITSATFALSHLVLGYRDSFVRRNCRTGIVGAITLSSLSAGPIIVLAVHGFLLSWNFLLRTIKLRWKILIGLLASLYVFVSSVAARSPLDVATSFFVFDPNSYWFRKLIWQYGSASALNNPVFGVGLNDWARPVWMPSSIDNFWLSIAVTHGLPATILILLTILTLVLSVSLKTGLDEKLLAYRTGFLITMVGFCIVLSTVSVWDAALAIFFFLLGSGVWVLDVKERKLRM
jgi:hypothetical protein